MEDLLDDERIRQKISELEETAKKEANSVIKKQLTNVLGTSSYTKIFGTAYDGAKGTAAGALHPSGCWEWGWVGHKPGRWPPACCGREGPHR